jgi:hypothetical protein
MPHSGKSTVIVAVAAAGFAAVAAAYWLSAGRTPSASAQASSS